MTITYLSETAWSPSQQPLLAQTPIATDPAGPWDRPEVLSAVQEELLQLSGASGVSESARALLRGLPVFFQRVNEGL